MTFGSSGVAAGSLVLTIGGIAIGTLLITLALALARTDEERLVAR